MPPRWRQEQWDRFVRSDGATITYDDRCEWWVPRLADGRVPVHSAVGFHNPRRVRAWLDENHPVSEANDG